MRTYTISSDAPTSVGILVSYNTRGRLMLSSLANKRGFSGEGEPRTPRQRVFCDHTPGVHTKCVGKFACILYLMNY